jgi:hypothetical protein
MRLSLAISGPDKQQCGRAKSHAAPHITSHAPDTSSLSRMCGGTIQSYWNRGCWRWGGGRVEGVVDSRALTGAAAGVPHRLLPVAACNAVLKAGAPLLEWLSRARPTPAQWEGPCQRLLTCKSFLTGFAAASGQRAGRRAGGGGAV